MDDGDDSDNLDGLDSFRQSEFTAKQVIVEKLQARAKGSSGESERSVQERKVKRKRRKEKERREKQKRESSDKVEILSVVDRRRWLHTKRMKADQDRAICDYLTIDSELDLDWEMLREGLENGND